MNKEKYIKDIKKNKICGFVVSVIAILVGVFTIAAHTGCLMEADFAYIFWGWINAALGAVGLMGVLHKEKNIPDGEIYCYPNEGGIFSVKRNIALGICADIVCAGMVFLLKTEDKGTVIGIAIIMLLIKFLSTIGVFCFSTCCIVESNDKIYVISFGGIRTVEFSDIEICSPSISFGGKKALDNCGRVIFRWGSDWENSLCFIEELSKHNIRFSC